eukprot:2722919-Prymnesium_polylepis.1
MASSLTCIPPAADWKLIISQEHGPWEAYVYDIQVYQGSDTSPLTTTFVDSNCNRWRYLGTTCTRDCDSVSDSCGAPCYNTAAEAFDSSLSTEWESCVDREPCILTLRTQLAMPSATGHFPAALKHTRQDLPS